MAERPDMEGHHECGWPAGRCGGGAGGVRGAADDGEGGVGSGFQVGIRLDPSGIEHGGVGGRVPAGEGEMGAATPLDGDGRVRTALVPGLFEGRLELFEAAAGEFRDEGVAVPEMAVRRGRADAGGPGKLGEGEAGETALGDEAEGRLDEGFAEIAVMVAVAPETHVRGVNIGGRACLAERCDIGPQDAVARWLERPTLGLNRKCPIDLLATRTGTAMMTDDLRSNSQSTKLMKAVRPLPQRPHLMRDRRANFPRNGK